MVHHLFPAVDPSHYPDLAPLVTAACAAHGVPYVAYRSWLEAWAKHVGWVARLNAVDPAARPDPAAACCAAAEVAAVAAVAAVSPRPEEQQAGAAKGSPTAPAAA